VHRGTRGKRDERAAELEIGEPMPRGEFGPCDP
jgi:hypothetical protein